MRPTEPSISPYLTVDDANRAIDFYGRAFGGEVTNKVLAPDGKRIMHANLRVNGGVLMLADDFPEWSGGKSSTPKALGGSPVTIHLGVPDVDSAWKRAVDAGAKVVMPLKDQFWGDRYGVLEDPFGHQWALLTHTRDVSPQEMEEAMRKMSKS